MLSEIEQKENTELNGAVGLDQMEQGVYQYHKVDRVRFDHQAAYAVPEYVSDDGGGGGA